MATANSAPAADTQPTGPAYSPRSKPSAPDRTSRARDRGRPQTAGVGWRAARRAASGVVGRDGWGAAAPGEAAPFHPLTLPGSSTPARRACKCWTPPCLSTPFDRSTRTEPGTHSEASAPLTQSRTIANSAWSFGWRNRSYASQKSASASAAGARGRVPATASDATAPPVREKSCSGEDPRKDAPPGTSTANW